MNAHISTTRRDAPVTTSGRARRLIAAMVAACSLASANGAAADGLALPGVTYATLGSGGADPGALITINPATGSGTRVGPTNIVGLSGSRGVPALAIASTGEIYAMDIGASSRLYKLNAADGSSTMVATMAINSASAIAFNGNDVLYAADTNGRLYVVNRFTGATTSIGASGVAIRGLAFHPIDGMLWASDTDGGIFKLNAFTGAATPVGNTGLFACPDLEFAQDGTLYGVDGGNIASNRLIRINQATGVGTVVGSSIGHSPVSGMAARLTRSRCLRPPGAGAIAYVKPDGYGNGSSWADAFGDLQAALETAAASCASISEIWVAAGTYYPTAGTVRAATFQLRNGVALRGGFAGTETSLAQRDWRANPTILSGNIGDPSRREDNSFNVVTGSGVNPTAILDGFTVTGGFGGFGGGMFNLSGSPTVTNIDFVSNEAVAGGGMFNSTNASPALRNVSFMDNTVFGSGSGLTNIDGCSPSLTNVAFVNGNGGFGPLANFINSNPTLTNVTIANNNVISSTGGIYNETGSNPTLINTIVWGNTPPELPQLLNDGTSSASISYSIIQGSNGSGPGWSTQLGIDGGHNIDRDPRFVDAAGGDVRLTAGSPAINAGLGAAVPPGLTTDLAGNPRLNGGAVDLGAYEFWCSSGPDCNGNGTPDECDIAFGTSADCNANGVPDECDVASASSLDCNGNALPDECELAADWAKSILDFSSEFSASDYAAAQALGPPNTLVYGDIPTAWAPGPQNGSLEFITLGFDPPAFADGVTIRETYGNGFVYQVDLLDTLGVLHPVWVEAPGDSDTSLPGTPAEFVVRFPVTPYRVIGVKVYVDTDHDLTSWEEIDAVRLHRLPRSADSDGNGQIDSCETTGLDRDPTPSSRMSLGPTYPQPARTGAKLDLALPREATVRFEVFDTSGRRVRKVLDRMLPAGRQTLLWDGRSSGGEPVTPGVYFAVIKAAGVELRRRVVVVR